MFRLEKNIYILKDNCRMFTKTVIQKNGTCICERRDSRLIGNIKRGKIATYKAARGS